MTRHQSSPAGDANRFHTIRWSVVLISAKSQASGCKEAFAELCRLYWYPLYGFIRHRGYSAEDAQDLAQGFFLHLIGMTTRKCANCPAREASAMVARSPIRAGTRFSRCSDAANVTVHRKALFRARNQTNKRALFTLELRPNAIRGVFQPAQSARIHAQNLRLSYFGSLEPDNFNTFVSSPQLLRS